jgi:hypothetical protein
LPTDLTLVASGKKRIANLFVYGNRQADKIGSLQSQDQFRGKSNEMKDYDGLKENRS